MASEGSASTAAAATGKVDPIAAVQDSIDGLALSLFEALRGVRDAVAPESLEVPGAQRPAGAAPAGATAAFKEEPDELGKNATAKDHLLHGLNMDYFPPRAFDLLEPDYHAFLMAYLGDDPYARELAERFAALEKAKEPPKAQKQKVAFASDDAQTSEAAGVTKAAAPATPTTTSDAPKADKKESPAKPANIELGDVGYEFRKKFDAGWFVGVVKEIRPTAPNGYDRRCVYTDGDVEDLRLEDLRELASLDPNNNNNVERKKPRLSIKLKVSKPKEEAPKKEDAEAKSTPTKDAPSKDQLKSPEPDVKFPLTQAEYTKLLLDAEHERDVRTTQTLARNVLAKSAAVDDLVANLPGMHRTREGQMERIAELIKSNHAVARELEEAHAKARERREEVRMALGECTCAALGVEEDA